MEIKIILEKDETGCVSQGKTEKEALKNIREAVKLYVKRGKNMTLRIILEPSDEGGFTVTVPALPGCISEGETREEAIMNIKEVVHLCLEPVIPTQRPVKLKF